MPAMLTSPTVTALFAALAKAQAAMKPAEFDKVNPAFKSKYASHASITHAALPALNANGIAVIQGCSADGQKVEITTLLAHASGEWISSTLTVNATQGTPQGIGSAITYGKRYALSAMVGVVADDDDDGEKASAPTRSEKTKAPPATVTPISKGQTVAPAARTVDERKRDLAAELASLGFASEGVKVFVRDTLGHDKASTPEELDKLEAALALVRARKVADKDADLAY